jgi:hypothetical protein
LLVQGLSLTWKEEFIEYHSEKNLPRHQHVPYDEVYALVSNLLREQTNLRRFMNEPDLLD